MMKNKFWITILFSFLGTGLYAQQYKANLNYSGSDGLYQIAIPPTLRAIIGNNIEWIRIKDNKENEAPFVNNNHFANEAAKNFSAISSVISQRTDSSSTYIIPNNQSARNNFVFEIANSDVAKDYIIDGSNDQKQWFSLVNNSQLSELNSDISTSVFKTIYFPNSEYKFIRISINDKSSAPLNVKNIGDWKEQKQTEIFEQIPNVHFAQKTLANEKAELYLVNKNGGNPIEKIKIIITNKGFFNREIIFYSSSNPSSSLSQYSSVINNTNANEFFFSPITNATFAIRIQNDDNRPLQIDSILLYEKPLTIIAQLDAGKQYQIYIDSNYKKPVYDLDKIKISKLSLPSAQIESLNKFATTVVVTPAKKYGNYLLWIGIGIGVMVLFFFGSNLLKDMGEHKK